MPPSEAGIEPDNWLSARCNFVTRPSQFMRTPYHLLSGASVFQFMLWAQFAPPVAS